MASVANEIALTVLRRRAEKALRASEERFRRLSESGFVSIAFFTPDGRITEANDAFLRLTGYSREDVTSGRVRWDRLTPPEGEEMEHPLRIVAADDELVLALATSAPPFTRPAPCPDVRPWLTIDPEPGP